MAKKQIIKNMLLAALWTIVGAGTVTLLVGAIHKKDAQKCRGVDVNIKGVSNNFFVDKKDIIDGIILITEEIPVGKTVGSFDLNAMEIALQKNTWIKSAQLFFDNNERLQVNVLEREPVARVFTTAGTTFYIDSSLAMLPLSEKFSARLPVFTNFPSDKKVLLKVDSNLLKDILTISNAIQKDSFYMAMIDQIDITAQRTFEMIPKFGTTIIVFGDAKSATKKLENLKLFYKKIIVKAGWNKYSEINVQYNNQVVAKRKGAEDVKTDSLRTLQLIQLIAENAERMSSDSLQTIMLDNENNTTNNSLIQQSIERDDNSTTVNISGPQIPPVLPVNEKVVTLSPAKNIKLINPKVLPKKANVIIKKSTPVKLIIIKKSKVLLKTPKQVIPKSLVKKPVLPKPSNEY